MRVLTKKGYVKKAQCQDSDNGQTVMTNHGFRMNASASKSLDWQLQFL